MVKLFNLEIPNWFLLVGLAVPPLALASDYNVILLEKTPLFFIGTIIFSLSWYLILSELYPKKPQISETVSAA